MIERLMTAVEARGIVPALAKHLEVSPGNAEETVADLIRIGEESLDLLRYRQQCPVCQTGTIDYSPAASGGAEFQCDTCGQPYLRSQATVPRPDSPDAVRDSLKFGWFVSQARGQWAEKQAKS